MFTFDPWQLLGIGPASSLNDARRAYYELARIVHPDRGGNAEDMRMLHDAYKWIYQQLAGATFPITVEDPSKTPLIDMVLGMDKASLEACYDQVKENDDPRTKTMTLEWVKYLVERDMMAGRDLRKIEQYMQESMGVVLDAHGTMQPASIPGGYEEMMDPHEEVTDYKMVTPPNPPAVPFCKEMIAYQEPVCASMFGMSEESLRVPQEKEDYSGNKERLCMTDYAIAYSPCVISDTHGYEKEKLDKMLAEKMRITPQ